MAISYGSYKPNRTRTVIYYVIAVAIVIIAAIIFFYPIGIRKTESTGQPVQVVEKPAEQPPPQKEQAPLTKPDFKTIVAEANNLTSPRVAAILKEAQKDIAEGRIIAARNTLNDIINMPMDENLREAVKKQLSTLAEDWLFSKVVQPGDNLCTTYKVQPGDILSQIAANFKVPYQFLMRINNIPSEKALQAGQIIKVVHGPFHAVAYLSTYTMDVYLQNVYVKSYKIGIGKEGHETPAGLWRVKAGGKLIKPTWTDPETGKTYHASDPDYPLGSGWIALEGIDSRTKNIQGIAIHGTNDETTIGTKSSRGCIRLYNGELIELYNMLTEVHSELRIVE